MNAYLIEADMYLILPIKNLLSSLREHGINIEADKYYLNGQSKMKRLRAFWEIEPNHVVGQALQSLLEYVDCAPKSVQLLGRSPSIFRRRVLFWI